MDRRWVKRLAVWGIFAAGTAVYSGCGRTPQSDTPGLFDRGQYAAAVRLYQENCAACHGNQLQGGVGPDLRHIGSKLTPAQIEHQIEVGGGPMPGYGPSQQGILTTAQIRELTAWLSTLR
ncbi:MAG: cytochrome c [Alicyclobacillus sp.]|nr:cytochrome c [Alicyclobacillus sp.]